MRYVFFFFFYLIITSSHPLLTRLLKCSPKSRDVGWVIATLHHVLFLNSLPSPIHAIGNATAFQFILSPRNLITIILHPFLICSKFSRKHRRLMALARAETQYYVISALQIDSYSEDQYKVSAPRCPVTCKSENQFSHFSPSSLYPINFTLFIFSFFTNFTHHGSSSSRRLAVQFCQNHVQLGCPIALRSAGMGTERIPFPPNFPLGSHAIRGHPNCRHYRRAARRVCQETP